jgi:hypothetical protein
VNSTKSEIHARYHKIPALRFREDRKLTSFAGLIVLQALLARLELKKRLQAACGHVAGLYGMSAIMMVVTAHLMLGFRRIREMDYYHDDPYLPRVLCLHQLPDVSTVTRTLSRADDAAINNTRREIRAVVAERVVTAGLRRVTLDFDGSVTSTTGHVEGTAVGYNKKKKGARSYYNLYCTVAQTEQFFDVHFRPGNVHDSNGALEFMDDCFKYMEAAAPRELILEARVDGAFFNDDIIWLLCAG